MHDRGVPVVDVREPDEYTGGHVPGATLIPVGSLYGRTDELPQNQEIIFVCGAGLISSALDVYIRDMRYIVESANTVLFWLVPIFYPFDAITERYREVYQYNPIAAMVMAMRNILLEARPPAWSLLRNLTISSLVVFGIGWLVFQKLKRRFYNYL